MFIIYAYKKISFFQIFPYRWAVAGVNKTRYCYLRVLATWHDSQLDGVITKQIQNMQMFFFFFFERMQMVNESVV